MEYKSMDKDIPNRAALWLLTVIIPSFIVIHLFNLNLSISDENTYFYMGNLIAQGSLPYKDFFYAHPPLNILIIALLIKIFGLNFTILKLVPVITTAISSIFVYLISKNLHSKLSGIIAVIMFLFSYQTLRVSTYLTGIDISVLFLMLGIYLLFKENKQNKAYLISGLFFGIAGISAFFSLVAALVIAIILLINNKRNFLYFILGFSSIFLTINAVLLLLFGTSYTTPLIKYHFLKPETISSFRILSTIVKDNWLLSSASLLFIFAKDKKRISALVIIVLVYLLFLSAYKSLFGYYIFITLPLLAIIASYSVFSLTDRIGDNMKSNQRIILISIFVLIGISTIFSANRYLSYKFQDFNDANEITNYIKTNIDPKTELFGDDSITPLLALLANKKIAFNHADLNNFRWRTGLVDIQETISEIKSEKPLIVTFQVNIPQGTFNYGISLIDEFQIFLEKECKVKKEFKDTWQGYEKVVKLWEC